MGNWTVRFTDNWQVIGDYDEGLGEHRIIAECGIDEWSEHNARLIADMAEALAKLLKRYVDLVECGDCGYWDAEAEECVIEARAALAKAGA